MEVWECEGLQWIGVPGGYCPVAFIRWKLQGVVRYSAGRYGGNSERFLNLEMVGSGVWRA